MVGVVWLFKAFMDMKGFQETCTIPLSEHLCMNHFNIHMYNQGDLGLDDQNFYKLVNNQQAIQTRSFCVVR